MIEWMTAHPWMTFTVLVLLASSFRFTFTLPIGDQGDAGCETGSGDHSLVTPDEARMHMLTPRERAARAVSDAIDGFCEHGDPGIVIELSPCDNAMIAELLTYQEAGWTVAFTAGSATIALPAVLS